MFLFKVVKKVINKMDLFSSIQLLRFDGDAETKTFTGGVISFTLIIYLISTFSSMIIDTFDKILIQSSADTNQDDEPEPVYLLTTNNASHFMLGVEVWHFDLTTGPRYFDVVLRNSFMVNGVPGNETIQYMMEPCTKEHWRALSNIQEIFYKVQMNTWLCMPLNITPVLQGKYYSDLQTTLDVVLSTCKNETDLSRPCAPQEQIDTFMAQNGPFYFTPFFYNPLINPQNEKYLSLYLEDKYYIMFSPGYGMEMYLYNAGYQITTDQSILPFSSHHNENGSIVTTVSSNAYFMGNTSDIYCFISFFRDPSTIVINRSYQKIIDAFSYVGGLLGSFLLVLIFVNFYNECSYEMRFASMYKCEKDSPTTAKKFNIGYYFLQSVYGLLQTIKVKCEKWRAVKYFHQTREEMVRQLDVRYLFKKLHILQNAVMMLLTKPQLKGLMLQHEMTVAEAKKMRKTYGLKNKIKKFYRQKLKQISDQGTNKNQSTLKISSEKVLQPINKKQMFSLNLDSANKKINFLKIQDANFSSKTIQQMNQDIKQSDSSQSSDSQEEAQTIQQVLIQDLKQLKLESQSNNHVSTIILKNLDPFVKKVYENCLGFTRSDSAMTKNRFFQHFQPEANVLQTLNISSNSIQKENKKDSLNDLKQGLRQKQQDLKPEGFFYIED